MKQHADVKHVYQYQSNYNLYTLKEREILSTWAPKRFYITCKKVMFVYNFDGRLNFCGENFAGNYFLRDFFYGS